MNNNFVKRFLGPMLLGLFLGFVLNKTNESVSFDLVYIVKSFYTITYNYTQILTFIAPIMIFVYVLSATNRLQNEAVRFFSKYVITIFTSLIVLGITTLVISYNLIPLFIQEMDMTQTVYVDPFMNLILDLQPLMTITTALFLSIFMGIFMDGKSSFIKIIGELEVWLNTFMFKVMLPLMPIWIFGTFLRSGFMSQGLELIINDLLLSLLVLIIQFSFLAIMTYLGARHAKKSYKHAVKAVIRLFAEIVSLAGMGTGIIIPLSVEEQTKLGLSKERAKIISSSSFNMPGSLISNIVFCTGIVFMFDLNLQFINLVVYVLFLIITLVAAPSVPGSVFAVTSSILEPLLGFGAPQIDLMGGLYYKQGTSNSATNHSADIYLGLLLDD